MLKALLTAALLCAALAGAAGAQKPTPEKRVPAPRGGEEKSAPAAPRAKVTQIAEGELKTLLAAGAPRLRPLLVNFWATWCVPCREEFPDLVELREQYADDKLDFVLISLDDPADIEAAVPEFLAEQRATHFPSYLLRADDDGAAINYVDPTWNGELPATFLYDRAGALVYKRKGRVRVPELRAALDEALKERPQEAGARK